MTTGNHAIMKQKYYWCHLSAGVWSEGHIEREHTIEYGRLPQTSICDGGTAITSLEDYYKASKKQEAN